MTRTNTLAVLALFTLATLGGCTPWATYPTVPGSVDISDPWIPPIPELMANAIRTTHERDGNTTEDPIAFNLPPNTPDRVHERVIRHLSSRGYTARPMTDASETAYHVIEVRVRTVESEVDVIHVGPSGEPEEVTLSYHQDIRSGQRLVRVRPWRYRVALPPPNYVPWEEPAQEWTEAPDGSSDGGMAGVESDQ